LKYLSDIGAARAARQFELAIGEHRRSLKMKPILQLLYTFQSFILIACSSAIGQTNTIPDQVVPDQILLTNLPADLLKEFKPPFKLDKNKDRKLAPNGTTYFYADYGWLTTILQDSNGRKVAITIVYPHPKAKDIYQVGWTLFDDKEGWVKGTGKNYKGKNADSLALLVHSILGKNSSKKLNDLEQQGVNWVGESLRYVVICRPCLHGRSDRRRRISIHTGS